MIKTAKFSIKTVELILIPWFKDFVARNKH